MFVFLGNGRNISLFENLGREFCAVLEDYQKSLILATETENTKTHFPNHMKINQKNNYRNRHGLSCRLKFGKFKPDIIAVN